MDWLSTLIVRECGVILQFWGHTVAPPIITTILYFAIFGEVIGKRVGQMGGVDYIQYISPGLIVLWTIVQAYGHTAGGLVGARFFKYIEELLVSPLPDWIVVVGYVISGAIRGILVGFAVLISTLFFTRLQIHSVAASCAVLLLTALSSSVAGIIAALFAKSFDQVYGVQNFVLTPLLYVGGIFSSVSTLPSWAQSLSFANPIFYIINGFRYGLLGVSDVPFRVSMSIIAAVGILLFIAAILLMRHGVGIRE
jgi:ABC-2 type transport system permease protein